MNIAEFSVKRPVAVTMWVAAIVLLGIICLTRLPVDLLPKITMPTISVSTTWPNVSPEVMEAQITRPIEQAVSSVPNLYAVTSSSTEGQSSVRVQFQWGTDIGQAAVDVLQLVERAKRRFPNDDTLQTPVVGKFDPNQMPILNFAVSGEDDPVKLRTILDNELAPMFESADGVASATVGGGMQRAILVNIDPVRLQAHKLAPNDIIRRITQENINQPAGIARHSDTEYTIRTLGWLDSLDELRRLPITAPNGQVVTLDQIAEVRDEHQEQRNFIRLNGDPACSIQITKQSGANTITTAKAVMERVERAKKSHPELKFSVAYDQSGYIKNSVDEVRNSAFIGGILAVLLLMFFLRNLRSTLVVALSIPISIIAAFALLYLCGFTINVMSLGGLSLATGLIVDDAVVVLENIFRHIERDRKSALEAAIGGTSEVLSAVIASTWTVMVVFLPLLMIRGQAGQMYTQFALVVIFALAVSLLSATTVVPMLSTRFIKGPAHAEEMEGVRHNWLERAFHRFGGWFDGLDRSYRNGLQWALRHRVWVLGGALVATGASLLLIPFIGQEMMPKTDSGDLSLNVKLPQGTALEKTNQVMKQIEEILLSDKENVQTVLANVGGGGRGSGASSGSVTIRLREDHKMKTTDVIAGLQRKLNAIPGVRPRLNQRDIVSSMMTGGDQNIEVDIFGQDLPALTSTARDLITRLRDVPGLENLDVNWQEAAPEIRWDVDRVKAAEFGLSFSDVASTISTSTNGSLASYFQEGGFQYPIMVQLPPEQRRTVDEMRGLVVTGSGAAAGKGVLLSQIAQPRFEIGPSEITRIDRQRYIAITGIPQGRDVSAIQADVQKIMDQEQLPTGYYWDFGVNQKRKAEEFAGMGVAVFLAIALVYMLLATQFESFVHPFTVLLSVPLAASGVVLGLFLTGRTFGLTAFVGVLMLVGIVVKNGILLVDYTNKLRERGLERDEAVLRAGPTRLRPILMTASAAVLGMLPMALGIGKGSEIQAPMATAVIGGLTTSTLLTLFVVPTMYTLLDDAARRLQRKRKAPTPAAPVPVAEGEGQ